MAGIQTDATIKVEGLAELRKALKKLSDENEYHKQLRDAGLKAGEGVKSVARGKTPKRTGRLADSIRVTAQQTGAQIKMGNKKTPYAGWIDYGGTITFKTRSGKITRPFIKTGRILYPSVAERKEETRRIYVDAVTQTVESAGLDVD